MRDMSPRPTTLPMWPLSLMFGLMPLWWAVGGLYLFWPLFALVLGVILLTRGRVLTPTGVTTWLLLIAVIVVSATRMDRVTAFFMYGLRLGFIVGALIVYLYVYNALRSGMSWERLFRPLCFFFLGMVVLGWIGVVKPEFGYTTPVEVLLPDVIASDKGVRAIVHAHATEFNPLSRNPYYRTAAPFPYTNNWGTAFAILIPCVVAYLTSVRSGWLRTTLIVALPFAVVPAFLTLNRGMFIGLGAGLIYLGVRALMRGDVRLIGSIAGVAVLGWIVTLFIPVVDLITNRTENTDSTSDRADLYAQTTAAVLKSPLLGYGAPRLVDTTHGAEPLGTQGQMWMMMYSHGIPALILFVLFFILVAWRLSAAVSPPGKWLSTVPVIALVVTPFYGFSDINLTVMFYAFGLAMAALDGPVDREVRVPDQNRPLIASA
jgi:polysaccharide biosynthesis protein PslJ